METESLKKEKVKVERKIMELLNQFMNSTKIKVSDIEAKKIQLSACSSPVVVQIKIKLEI